jgi:hypothetical protein
MDDNRQELDLSNFCEGSLNREFKEQYTSIISQLVPGEKGAITISIGILKPEDCTTIAAVNYSINGKGPKRKKVQFADIVDGCFLKVDPVKPSNVKQLKLVEEAK